jgi:hypothetical protein
VVQAVAKADDVYRGVINDADDNESARLKRRTVDVTVWNDV